MTKQEKTEIVKEFGKNAVDTGSSEVQIALISKRIKGLTEHFKAHAKDNNSRRGLHKLVGSRRKLLSYLKKEDMDRYRAVLGKLDLRK